MGAGITIAKRKEIRKKRRGQREQVKVYELRTYLDDTQVLGKRPVYLPFTTLPTGFCCATIDS